MMKGFGSRSGELFAIERIETVGGSMQNPRAKYVPGFWFAARPAPAGPSAVC
jgi:hypothetical protein